MLAMMCPALLMRVLGLICGTALCRVSRGLYLAFLLPYCPANTASRKSQPVPRTWTLEPRAAASHIATLRKLSWLSGPYQLSEQRIGCISTRQLT